MSRAQELLDAATPLPWDESSEGRTLRSNIDLLAWAHPADAALIVYAVNRLPAYEAAVEALWRLRTHELNIDGSPCWCPTENEPDEHGESCLEARKAVAS